MFDAVDAGTDQLGHRLLPEAVGGDARTLCVCRCDRHAGLVGIPQRGKVAQVAIDPIADQLHPTVPGGPAG